MKQYLISRTGGNNVKVTKGNHIFRATSVSLVLAASLIYSSPALARDTDVYKVDTKQNAYVLMDNSGSMRYGVYQHTIDYGAMYDYLYTLNDTVTPAYDYIYDPPPPDGNGATFYLNHVQRNKIYLLKGDPSVSIVHADNKDIAFTGDPARSVIDWDYDNKIDTHTLIDNDGNLSDDGTGQRRITVIGNGDDTILLDGTPLPLGLNIKLHDLVTLHGGSQIDNGLGGLLNAPGFYFSGYKQIDTVSPYSAAQNVAATDGDQNIYFLVTGNWINMQKVFNLKYKANPPGDPASGDLAWIYEPYPIGTASWATMLQTAGYPASGNYPKNRNEFETSRITIPGALKMRLHFSSFDVKGDNKSAFFGNDFVKIYTSTNATVAKYDNDNAPTTTSGGWSPEIAGSTAIIKLFSNNDNTQGTGYKIDKIAIVTQADAVGGDIYLMQSRLKVAQEAMKYVVDEFRGKMNWGFATFDNGDGAHVAPVLNPSLNDDANRTAIKNQIDLVTANGGTPLMEALQDVWEEGYYKKRQVLSDLNCRKNYIISMTDGFPSVDNDNTRIPGITFSDADADDWTSDPSQPPVTENYYDDVANWMYRVNWRSDAIGTLVADPANSYDNVITHHISFGANHPLLKDAAAESGGEYIVANNKEQLIAAFYSLALLMTDAVSFTAPVVSVDAVNKIQSGEDLYMGLFLPQDDSYWPGNLKKFKIGDGSSADRPERFMIYDAQNKPAIEKSTGEFKDNTDGFWGDENDPNDSDNYGAADIMEDGAGEVLLEDLTGFFNAVTYWNRPIYTWKDGAMVKFDRVLITKEDLDVIDDVTRDKLINFIHGYTYESIAATGAPLAVRTWILGSIIHSRPVVVDYFDTAQANLPLLKRFVVVGSNDGMLHVFDDTTGREVFAFIPPDILPKLKEVQANNMYDTVDGLITLYRRAMNPKYLIFGERRGGNHFCNLDVSNMNPLLWTVAWDYTNAEISQSWSEVKVASLPVAITTDGLKSYKDVAIFTGGYDPEEDNFPEPFTDSNSNGSVDGGEWTKNSQDLNNDNTYNLYNPGMNENGRAIFVVDIDDPATITNVTLSDASTKQILPFSVTYGATSETTGVSQTLPDMKFSFPASPSVVTGTDEFIYIDNAGQPTTGLKENVLLSVYAIDVYANLFKTRFSFDVENTKSITAPDWKIKDAAWKVNKVFSANPSSKSGSGRMGVGADVTDQGRKAFYPPAISWGGSKGFFEAGNYFFKDVKFGTKDKMASLFFGTGDRENPKYTMIRNRFYAVYDDSSVTAERLLPLPITTVPVTSVPYVEDDLLNLTCDELGKDSVIMSCWQGAAGGCDANDGTSADVDMKKYLKSLLTDDAVYNQPPSALEEGLAHENDAKGWYIILDSQGKSSACGHMAYPTAIVNSVNSDRDNHAGEQVLSQAILYYGTLYFTSYQASMSDPCNPQGNGFSYALNYLNGSATYDLTQPPDDKRGVTDRYKKFNNIFGIPSGFTVITSGGHAAAMASMGGAIVGPGPDPLNPFEIATPGLGLELFYWRDSNSQQP